MDFCGFAAEREQCLDSFRFFLVNAVPFAVFVRLERSAQNVSHIPNDGCFLSDIRSDNTDFIVRHFLNPLSAVALVVCEFF